MDKIRYVDGKYRVLHGPEGLLPPAAALAGVILPDFEKVEQGLLNGELVPEEKVMEEIAVQFLTRRNPTFFPGPLILWGWNHHTVEKARATLELIAEIPGVNIIPMPDYRPIYPKIDPEAVMNPCHPNLTIWFNKIEVCAFIGVHCHFANVTLKMIRAGTNCYTVALCAEAGHEDAMASIADMTLEKIYRLRDIVKKVRDSGKVTPWAYTEAGRAELTEKSRTRKKMPTPELVGKTSSAFGHDLHQGLDENEE